MEMDCFGLWVFRLRYSIMIDHASHGLSKVRLEILVASRGASVRIEYILARFMRLVFAELRRRQS